MSLYLDTSVLVALVTIEPHSDRARRFLDRDGVWRISDWAAAEFSAAIRIKARRGEAPMDRVAAFDAGLDELRRRLSAALPVSAEDHQSARRLVARHDPLRAPDALHLAIAQRADACMVTFDKQLAQVAEAEGLRVMTP